jgi:hypothetical protein
MAIWVIKDGQREGPYEEQDVRELIYEGTYGDADPAIRDGQYDWTTLGQILGHQMPHFESALSAVGPPVSLEFPPEEPIPASSPSQPPPMPLPPQVANPASEPGTPAAPPAPAQVTIVDFQMPFGSMVLFMVKWAIAAIPAMLILGAIVAIFWIGCLAFMALLLHH